MSRLIPARTFRPVTLAPIWPAGRWYALEADNTRLPLNAKGYANAATLCAALELAYECGGDVSDYVLSIRPRVPSAGAVPRVIAAVARMAAYEASRSPVEPAPEVDVTKAHGFERGQRVRIRDGYEFTGTERTGEVVTQLHGSQPAWSVRCEFGGAVHYVRPDGIESIPNMVAQPCQPQQANAAPLPPLVAAFDAIMSDETYTAGIPSPEMCRAVIEYKASKLPEGPELWAIWYVAKGSDIGTLCEFDGSVCYECYRTQGAALRVARELNARRDGDSGHCVVARIPAGVAGNPCDNPEDESPAFRASGPVVPWEGAFDGGWTVCNVRLSDLGAVAAPASIDRESPLARAYRWHRINLQSSRYELGAAPAHSCLEAARADVAAGRARYPVDDTRGNRFAPVDPAQRDWRREAFNASPTRARWIEAPAHAGLRFVGWCDEIRDMNHKGWFTSPNGDTGEVMRGCVYQLPARDGRTIYVPAYGDPCNGSADAGGPAFVYLDEIQFGELGGNDGRDSLLTSRDEQSKRDAALIADRRAESAAEEARDYSEAWQSGLRYAELGEELKSVRLSTRAILNELREATGEKYKATYGRAGALYHFAESRCKLMRKRHKLFSEFGNTEGFREHLPA